MRFLIFGMCTHPITIYRQSTACLICGLAMAVSIIFSVEVDTKTLANDLASIMNTHSERTSFVSAVADDCRRKYGCHVVVARVPNKHDLSFHGERIFALLTWNKKQFGLYGFEYGHFFPCGDTDGGNWCAARWVYLGLKIPRERVN